VLVALIAVLVALSPGSPPAADAPIPREPAAIAGALRDTTLAAEADARAWLRTNPAVGANPPETLSLRGLYQQRIYRVLRSHPRLTAKVIAALPAAMRAQATDNVQAGRELLELSPKHKPKTQPPIKPGVAAPPQQLLRWYREAQRRFGVRWQTLAAINLVESDFNRLRNNSYAGAQGPMQFEPATWQTYGLGGNVRDPHDAIMGAANYLRANGARADVRAALYHYNPSGLYVDAVSRYARQMQLRSERFFVYWNWQVFVRDWKTGRDKRLTGPGL
jgi:membrane-bound lytic murein transglycosylase B